MATPPSLPTTWANSSLREDNLPGAVNDLATAANTAFPVGVAAWTDYTPALTAFTTNPTLGTGSVQYGRRFQIGKLVVCQFKIKFGTSGTAAGSGLYFVSIPTATTANAVTHNLPVGHGYLLDNSSGGPGAYRQVTFYAATTTTALVALGDNHTGTLPTFTASNLTTDRTYNADATSLDELADVLGTLAADLTTLTGGNTLDLVQHNAPWSWAASDAIVGQYMYEAA
jgi:hypothetical protein